MPRMTFYSWFCKVQLWKKDKNSLLVSENFRLRYKLIRLDESPLFVSAWLDSRRSYVDRKNSS